MPMGMGPSKSLRPPVGKPGLPMKSADMPPALLPGAPLGRTPAPKKAAPTGKGPQRKASGK